MDEKLVARPPQFNKSTARASPPAMHGPRSDRLAAELRDVLANLDNIRDTLNGLAADAVENSIVLGAIDSPALRAHAIAAVSVASLLAVCFSAISHADTTLR
jgi:hypothetical protein